MKSGRHFLDTPSISKYLYCSICLEVFTAPMRIRCGHTYCSECLKSWAKSANTCPQCRERFSLKTSAKDLLAENLVAELKVKCAFSECVWVGALGSLASHEEKCVFHPDRVQDWKSVASKVSRSSLLSKLYAKDPAVVQRLLKSMQDCEVAIDFAVVKPAKRVKPNSTKGLTRTNQQLLQ